MIGIIAIVLSLVFLISPGTSEPVSVYEIPEGVTSLVINDMHNGFYIDNKQCIISEDSHVERIVLPSTFIDLDGYAGLSRFRELKYIDVNENNPVFSSLNGLLTNKDKTVLLLVPAQWNNKPNCFDVPYGIKIVDSLALIALDRLETINLSETVCHFSHPTYNTFLSYITVDQFNPNYTSTNGVLFSKDMSSLMLYPPGKKNTVYIIPENVMTIGEFAFTNTHIETIVCSNSLRIIEDWAFTGCVSLKQVYWNNRLEIIGTGAFQDTDLTVIDLPESVKIIESEAFFLLDLDAVYLPPSLLYISSYAFFDSPTVDMSTMFYIKSGTYAELFVKKEGYNYVYKE